MQLNQLPGAAIFASKVRLARTSSDLPFLPRSFILPEQAVDFREYAYAHPEAEWLSKGSQHRGVSIIADIDEAIKQTNHSVGAEDEPVFVQQLVRPYLIDQCVLLSEFV
jgi:hypothetical protein